MQKRKGFTTVELVIVIAVIAILATALIPTFGGLIKSANHNVDVQAANQLTALVVMHSVNHPITSERELADAINEGMNDPNYYANLQAKSAKYGYCFWYDYKDPQGARVRVGTVKEIAKIAAERVASAFSIDDVRLGSAGSTSSSNNWGLRAQIVDGFFLMCHKGDYDLVNLIVSLENADQDTYGKTLVELEKLPDSEEYKENETVKTAISEFVGKAITTPILNENGLFTTETIISSVYIPYDVGELASTSVNVTTLSNGTFSTDSTATVTLTAGFKLELPSGTKIAADILDLERADNVDNSNPMYNGSHEIHLDIEEDELGDYFYADTTDAVIVIPSGSYIQEGDSFKKLDGSPNGATVENVTAAVYGNLTSFGVGFDDSVADKSYVLDVLQTNKTLDYDLYISADHTGSVTLTAGTFLGYFDDPSVTENLPVRSVTVTLTKKGAALPEEISNSGLSATLTGLADGDVIKVKAREITKTYTVKIKSVDSFEISTISGSSVFEGNKTSGYKLELKYNTGNDSWKISYSPAFANNNADIDLNDKLTVTSNYFNFDENTNILTLKSAQSGELNDVLTVTCGGKSVTVTVKLFDATLSAFTQNANLNSMSGKGNGYVVGLYGSLNGQSANGSILTLDKLFTIKDEAKDKFERWTLTIQGASEPYEITDWATFDLQSLLLSKKDNIAVDTELKLTLSSYDGVSTEVTIFLALDAYNVTNAAEWAAVPTGENKSIAVLNAITIDGGNAPANYIKDVGSATVYGNLKRITVTNFKYRTSAEANTTAFITINNGAVEYVIIDGPDYGSTVSIIGTDSQTKGTYVAAIHVKGTKAIGSSISHSFISGFRSPVQAQSGKITITDTTLHRGNYANISVDGATDLVLDGVTTIQYEVNNHIGAGIAYKYNSGTSTIIAQGAGLNQYNFYNKDQIKAICNAAANILGTGSIKVNLTNDHFTLAETKIGHTINSTQYYQVGIIEIGLNISKLGQNRVGTPSVTATLPGYSTTGSCTASITGILGSYGSAYATLRGQGKCTSCNHSLPSTDIDTHITAFLQGVQ